MTKAEAIAAAKAALETFESTRMREIALLELLRALVLAIEAE